MKYRVLAPLPPAFPGRVEHPSGIDGPGPVFMEYPVEHGHVVEHIPDLKPLHFRADLLQEQNDILQLAPDDPAIQHWHVVQIGKTLSVDPVKMLEHPGIVPDQRILATEKQTVFFTLAQLLRLAPPPTGQTLGSEKGIGFPAQGAAQCILESGRVQIVPDPAAFQKRKWIAMKPGIRDVDKKHMANAGPNPGPLQIVAKQKKALVSSREITKFNSVKTKAPAPPRPAQDIKPLGIFCGKGLAEMIVQENSGQAQAQNGMKPVREIIEGGRSYGMAMLWMALAREIGAQDEIFWGGTGRDGHRGDR